MFNPGLILVTGSAGRIGQAAVKELLARGHAVRGFDRAATPHLSDHHVGDVTDAAAVQRAMAGVKTLIHLAATPDDADFVRELLPNNLLGVYHVLESAREAGVRRMVLASSGQVIWYQRFTGPWPIGPDVPVTPRSWYAATKVFMESAGRSFAEAHGMEVIAVRLGWCPRSGQEAELAATQWAHDVFLSPGDAGRFFACAVEAPLKQRYAVVYASSRPVSKLLVDPEPARTLLGFSPADTYPEGLDG